MKQETLDMDYKGIFPMIFENEERYLQRGKRFLDNASGLEEHLKQKDNLIVFMKELYNKKPDLMKEVSLDSFGIVNKPKNFVYKGYHLNIDWVSLIIHPCRIIYQEVVNGFEFFICGRTLFAVTSNVKGKREIEIPPVAHLSNDKVLMPFAIIGNSFESNDSDAAYGMATIAHEEIHCARTPLNEYQSGPAEEGLTKFFSDLSSGEAKIRFLFESRERDGRDRKRLLYNGLGILGGLMLMVSGIGFIASKHPVGFLPLGAGAVTTGANISSLVRYYSERSPKFIYRLDNLGQMFADQRLHPVLIRLKTDELMKVTKKPSSFEEVKRYIEKGRHDLRKKIILEKFF